MQDCWLDPYTSRPSFTDIARVLENIVESDGVSYLTSWVFLKSSYLCPADKTLLICYRIMWTLTTKEWWLWKQLQQLALNNS